MGLPPRVLGTIRDKSMKNVIIPEIGKDADALKEELSRQLPAGYKIKTPPLNRKCLRVVKSLGIVTEVHLRSDRIVVHNATPMYAAFATLCCVPLGLYLILKMKDSAALRTQVHGIVERATGALPDITEVLR